MNRVEARRSGRPECRRAWLGENVVHVGRAWPVVPYRDGVVFEVVADRLPQDEG